MLLCQIQKLLSFYKRKALIATALQVRLCDWSQIVPTSIYFQISACSETTYKVEISSAPFPSEIAFENLDVKKKKKGYEYFR